MRPKSFDRQAWLQEMEERHPALATMAAANALFALFWEGIEYTLQKHGRSPASDVLYDAMMYSGAKRWSGGEYLKTLTSRLGPYERYYEGPREMVKKRRRPRKKKEKQ